MDQWIQIYAWFWFIEVKDQLWINELNQVDGQYWTRYRLAGLIELSGCWPSSRSQLHVCWWWPWLCSAASRLVSGVLILQTAVCHMTLWLFWRKQGQPKQILNLNFPTWRCTRSCSVQKTWQWHLCPPTTLYLTLHLPPSPTLPPLTPSRTPSADTTMSI